MTAIEPRGRRGAAALLLLAIIGGVLAAYLTYLHVRLHHDPTYVSVCAVGETLNCETVAASNLSIFAELPVSVWGLTGYLLIGWLALSRIKRQVPGETAGLLALFGIVLAAVSLLLAAISTFLIGALCLLCTATYVVNFAIAGIAIARARRRGGLVAAVRADLRALLAEPAPAARRGAIVLLAVVALHAAMPRYWELASWRHPSFGRTGTTEEGYPWLGAERPALTIHEYADYECPRCRAAHRKLRRVLSQHHDEIRIVRHDYARMACKPNDAVRRRRSCAMSRAGFCAAKLGQFWEWNDAVMAHPRPLSGEERDTYTAEMAERLGLDRAEFDACLFDEETVERAHGVFKDARRRGIRETPAYVVDGRKVSWDELLDLVDERL